MQIDDIPRTGPEAIEHALSKLDLNKLEAEAKQIIASKKVSKRPKAIQTLHIINGLKRNELQPKDLMISKVPVIPPQFRPFSAMGNTFIAGDANELYRDFFKHLETYKESEQYLGKELSGDARMTMYDAAKALYGYGDSPNPKIVKKGVSGFLGQLLGKNSPKNSFLQRKLISKTTDNTGRSTIVVDPELGLDEIGIPHDIAFPIYGSYLMGRLVKNGMSPKDALAHIKERSQYAHKAIQEEMKERPVMYSRSPAWHKFSVLAAKPKLIEGNAIAINPLTTTGLNADFDGDFIINKLCILTNKRSSEYNKDYFCDSCLTSFTPAFMIPVMINHTEIPKYDATTQEISIIDVEDFPRGEIMGHREDGKNGAITLYTVPKDLKVLALDESNGKPIWAEVSVFSSHPGREVEVVNLLNGKQLITDDDPRAVYGVDPSKPEQGFIRCTPTEALDRKLCVPVSPNVGEALLAFEELTEIQITEDEECLFRNRSLDWDFGYLLGAIAGDGWWDKQSSDKHKTTKVCIHIADLKEYNAKYVKSVFERWEGVGYQMHYSKREFFKEMLAGRYGDTVKHTFSFKHSGIFTDFLTKHLGGGGDAKTAGSGNKHLSSFMFRAPRAFREGLLCGLIDTDGSCSVSNGKSKPQLMIGFSSTSLRLVRDVKFLASTLGIYSNISFGKTTTAGNTSWQLTFSTVDCKSCNIFAALQSPWKRDAFLLTPVDPTSGSANRSDTVLMPTSVAAILSKAVGAPKITKEMRELGGAELEEKKEICNIYQQVVQGAKKGVLTRQSAEKVVAYLEIAARRNVIFIKQAAALAVNNKGKVDAKTIYTLRDAISKTAPFGSPLYKDGQKVYAQLNKPLKTGVFPKSTSENIAKFLTENSAPPSVLEHPEVKNWIENIVNNTAINWSPVVSVEKTGKKEDGYDLTVPGYETFMSADGVILSNTITVHAPATPQAVKDCYEKLMPSKMLFSIRDMDKVMPALKHETILGAFSAQMRPAKQSHIFGDYDSAVKAAEHGDISLQDDVKIPSLGVD